MSHNPDWMLRHRCDRLTHELRAAEHRIVDLASTLAQCQAERDRAEQARDDALDELAHTRDELAATCDQLAEALDHEGEPANGHAPTKGVI